MLNNIVTKDDPCHKIMLILNYGQFRLDLLLMEHLNYFLVINTSIYSALIP